MITPSVATITHGFGGSGDIGCFVFCKYGEIW